jgi:hypothetical protein
MSSTFRTKMDTYVDGGHPEITFVKVLLVMAAISLQE